MSTFAAGQDFKVFVGNLPSSVTQEELTTLFSPYGTVTESVLLPPRASQSDQRCGFVKYSSATEASAAIQAINGTDWGGSKLAVRMADAGRKQQQQQVGFNAMSSIMPAMYNAAAAAYGMGYGYGYGGYGAGYGAGYGGYGTGYGYGQQAYGSPMGAASGGSSGGAGGAADGKLFVGNIPSYWTKDNLAAQFGPFGALEETVILARKGINDTQCGFVKFVDSQSATMAMQSLAGTVVDGASLVVRFADKGRQGGQGGPMRTPRPPMQGFQPY